MAGGLLFAAIGLLVILVVCWLGVVLVERVAGSAHSRRTHDMMNFFERSRSKWLLALAGAGLFFIGVCYSSFSNSHNPSRTRGIAQRARFSYNNMKPLAQAVMAYAATKPPVLFPAEKGDTVHSAALFLSQSGKLNDARTYFYPDDPAAPGDMPDSIVWIKADGQTVLNQAFVRATLSVEMAANYPPDVPADTPIAWTRGLRPDGTWAADSPFKGLGGFIAFFDGRVEWYEKLGSGVDDDHLHKFNSKAPTVNILEALPSGAVILPATPAAGK